MQRDSVRNLPPSGVERLKLRILALIVALPAIILLLNLTVYALTGAGFLPPATEQDIHGARIFVTFLSASGALILLGASFGA
jgi:hypothetical protein